MESFLLIFIIALTLALYLHLVFLLYPSILVCQFPTVLSIPSSLLFRPYRFDLFAGTGARMVKKLELAVSQGCTSQPQHSH
jgi:hypothetical protein